MASVFVLFRGRGDEFVEVDVPAPARVCDVRKALQVLVLLSFAPPFIFPRRI